MVDRAFLWLARGLERATEHQSPCGCKLFVAPHTAAVIIEVPPLSCSRSKALISPPCRPQRQRARVKVRVRVRAEREGWGSLGAGDEGKGGREREGEGVYSGVALCFF